MGQRYRVTMVATFEDDAEGKAFDKAKLAASMFTPLVVPTPGQTSLIVIRGKAVKEEK
jgi:hypothetical protein